MFSRWLNPKCGLELNPDLSHNKRHNENGIYFLAHMLMLKKKFGILTEEDTNFFQNTTLDLQAYRSDRTQVRGCYDRGAEESLEFIRGDVDQIRLISHDNITGVVAGSLITDSRFNYDVALFGAKHLMSYDNQSPEKPRYVFKNVHGNLDTSIQFHPRDVFYWMYFSGHKILKVLASVLMPIFWISSIIDCLTPYRNTSSKLLTILRVESAEKSFSMRVLRWICYKMLKRLYGSNFAHIIYSIYFHQKDHPLPKLLELYDFESGLRKI